MEQQGGLLRHYSNREDLSLAGTLSTVVVAALTSGAVTLGIEWVFKPRLEARKERMLELHRKRRKFELQMVTVMINVAKWSDLDLSSERPDTVTRLLIQDRDTAEQQIDATIAAMNVEAFEIAAPYLEPIRSLVIRYIFNMRMIHLSDRPQSDKWPLLLELTKNAHVWLFDGTWRIRKRGKAMFRLRRALDDLEIAQPGSR
jgi:hypothetical protein